MIEILTMVSGVCAFIATAGSTYLCFAGNVTGRAKQAVATTAAAVGAFCALLFLIY